MGEEMRPSSSQLEPAQLEPAQLEPARTGAYVSIDEAARMLGIDRTGISKLLKRGRLHGIAPTEWRVSVGSIQAFRPQRGRRLTPHEEPSTG